MPYILMEKVDTKWLKRWQKGGSSDRQTIIGRFMTREKKRAINHILNQIDTTSILETGCGMGHTTEVFRSRNLSYLAIDISGEAVNVCQKKGLNVRKSNIKEVKETYDLVFSDGMLEHFLNFPSYASHMARISRRYVLLIQPNYNSITGQTLAWLANIFRSYENVYEYNYRLEDFIDVFNENGFFLIQNLPAAFDVIRILLFERTPIRNFRL